MTTTRLPQSPYLSVIPTSFREKQPVDGIPYPTYASLLVNYLSYSQMLAAESTYGSILVNHPGYPGGVPARPGGYGIELGVIRNGVEWWVTDADGLEGAPAWDIKAETPAVGDGTWLLEVRSSGRDVTVKGAIVASQALALGTAIAEVGAALTNRPRTGWLNWSAPDGFNKRLSVALSGATKVRRIGNTAAEFEMTLKGVDVGSPGAGVYLETPGPVVVPLSSGQVQSVVVPGLVPTPPRLLVKGSCRAGAVFRLGNMTVTTTADVLAAQTLVVDSRSKTVEVNGTPQRALIQLEGGRWPLLGVDAPQRLEGTFEAVAGQAAPQASVEVTGLW